MADKRRDFSWKALANSVIGQNNGVCYGSAHGDQTLQDYWRRDPATGIQRTDEEMRRVGELIEGGDGSLWHIAHAPFALKKDWDERQRGILELVINSRLSQAQESMIDDSGHAYSPDGRAQFQGVVLLDTPRTSRDVDGCLFIVADNAVFRQFGKSSQTYGRGASFVGATFGAFADFKNAVFQGPANFAGATFEGRAIFLGATFGETRFDGAKFAHGAEFSSASSTRITFVRACFGRASFFNGVTFLNSSFADAVFMRNVGFQGATLPFANFIRASFRREVDFSEVKVELSGNFAAHFATMPNFVGAKLHPDVSFYGMRATQLGRVGFALQLVFGSLVGLALVCWVGAVLLFGSPSWLVGLVAALSSAPAAIWIVAGGIRAQPQVEASNARTLMKISAENRNHLDEARFFRHQLKAQRFDGPADVGEILRNPAQWLIVKPIEKFIGIAYEVAADYGLSFMRPLISAVLLVALAGFLLWAWEAGEFSRGSSAGLPYVHSSHSPFAAPDAALFEAIGYSASRVFPFGSWGEIKAPNDSKVGCNFAARLLAVEHCRPRGIRISTRTELEGHRLRVRFIGALQSSVAVALVFLFGLALRRRFQIG